MTLAVAALGTCFIELAPHAVAVVVATDSYESASGLSFGGTSGTGFGAYTTLAGNGDGGVYFENSTRKIDGNGSLGVYGNNTGTIFGRTVTNTSAYTGQSLGIFDVSLRFDIANSNAGFKGINLKSGLGTTFGDTELFSIGMTNATNNGLLITGSASQTVNFGAEVRGSILDIHVQWNLATGAYSLTATQRGNSNIQTASGNFNSSAFPSSYAVGAIGYLNSQTGANQNVIYDNLQLQAVPEISSFVFAGVAFGVGTIVVWKRRSSETA